MAVAFEVRRRSSGEGQTVSLCVRVFERYWREVQIRGAGQGEEASYNLRVGDRTGYDSLMTKKTRVDQPHVMRYGYCRLFTSQGWGLGFGDEREKRPIEWDRCSRICMYS